MTIIRGRKRKERHLLMTPSTERLLIAVIALLTLVILISLRDRPSLPPERETGHAPYQYEAASQGYLSMPDQWYIEVVDPETLEIKIKH